MIRSNDGRKWQDKVTLRESSDDRPALATFGGVLYLAWKGTNRQPKCHTLSEWPGFFMANRVSLIGVWAGQVLAVYRDKSSIWVGPTSSLWA